MSALKEKDTEKLSKSGSKIVFGILVAITVAIGLPVRAVPGDSNTEKFQPYAEKINLIDRALAPWNSANRWRVEYEALPFPANSGFAPVHRIMAVSWPGDLYFLNAHFSPTQPWQLDPLCQDFFTHEGRTCRRRPFNRAL